MSAQIMDVVVYQGKPHDLVGINGKGLFHPRDEGLTASAIDDECERGYHCQYAVLNGQLLLTQLLVGLNIVPGQRMRAFGKILEAYHEIHPRDHTSVYKGHKADGLMHPVPFTGGLLVGATFLDDLFEDVGFQQAYKYRKVVELILENGQIVKETDCSGAMRDFRKAQKVLPIGPDDPRDPQSVREWVERSYRQDYSWD